MYICVLDTYIFTNASQVLSVRACKGMCVLLRPMINSNPEVRWYRKAGVLNLFHIQLAQVSIGTTKSSRLRKDWAVFSIHFKPRFLLEFSALSLTRCFSYLTVFLSHVRYSLYVYFVRADYFYSLFMYVCMCVSCYLLAGFFFGVLFCF